MTTFEFCSSLEVAVLLAKRYANENNSPSIIKISDDGNIVVYSYITSLDLPLVRKSSNLGKGRYSIIINPSENILLDIELLAFLSAHNINIKNN